MEPDETKCPQCGSGLRAERAEIQQGYDYRTACVDPWHEAPPSQGEVEEALGDAQEGFYADATYRRCLDCSKWVRGGPTRCQDCVHKVDYQFPEELFGGSRNKGLEQMVRAGLQWFDENPALKARVALNLELSRDDLKALHDVMLKDARWPRGTKVRSATLHVIRGVAIGWDEYLDIVKVLTRPDKLVMELLG